MSRSKGVSAEEKKARMLQLFYEKREFFQLKDLEKIAPKEKGIIANSVKDVVQKLVDEGEIDTDKIGTSVYFWAFPSKATNTRKRKLAELTNQYEQSNKKLKVTEESLAELELGKEDTVKRNEYLDEVMDLEIQKKNLNKELQHYVENDPVALKKMQDQIKGLKEAANRWTDNIFSVKSWCKRKFNVEDQMLNKQFGISSDLDYVE
ncbi:hypothetical protein RN001_013404 [Aquatica leii]|uniref:Meiotic nuclear division protein 1 homolog n=1 Tax=Aquatica leii TaxID=1421715 RepID=A0AAN7P020_9COLE|nr:hypothetical protein RN001_013404 [Aquatica leii]